MTNSISIVGRLAFPPELKFSKSGTVFCNVTIPDQKRVKDQSGQWQDASDTTWFRATVFGEEAEYLAENAEKGSVVTVTGRLITRSYTTQGGEERTSLEVDYAKVGIVQGPSTRSAGQHAPPPQGDPWATQSAQQSGGGFGGGEIPF